MKRILTTDPHAAQSLFQTENPDGKPIGNQLFTLRDDEAEITFTGEELDSFTMQWEKYSGKTQPKTTPRELATILAALRYWQLNARNNGAWKLAEMMQEHFTVCQPLTAGEIDELCERINQ